MKTVIIFLLPICGLLAACTTTPPINRSTPTDNGNASPTRAFAVHYKSVMFEVHAEDGMLRFAERSPRSTSALPEHDTITHETALTRGIVNDLRNWLQRYDVMALTPPDAPGDPDDFAAAFFHRLHVTDGGREKRLEWTNAGRWSDRAQGARAKLAAQRLVELARRQTGASEDGD